MKILAVSFFRKIAAVVPAALLALAVVLVPAGCASGGKSSSRTNAWQKRVAEAEKAREREYRALLAEVSANGKKIYVASDNVFGWVFCSRMQRFGWKCIVVKEYDEIPLTEEERASQFLVKFSGRCSRDDFAESVTGTLVDLRTGASRRRISRKKISAGEFAVALAEFFNPGSFHEDEDAPQPASGTVAEDSEFETEDSEFETEESEAARLKLRNLEK